MSNGADDSLDLLIRVKSDASGAAPATEALNEAAGAQGKQNDATAEGGKAAEKAHVSHRALHMIFRQIGGASKGLEVGLMALSGVMMGSLTFGVYAVMESVRALSEHFKKQKEVALESAKATVQFWKDALQGNTDARQAVADYAEAMEKIIRNVDTLKRKESEEGAVLKAVLAQRLKILEVEREVELAAAKGDKEEQARINERYGKRKTNMELQNEQAEIDLKRRNLDEQVADGARKVQIADAAAAAKAAGAPGRAEASAAKDRAAGLKAELDKLQAAYDAAPEKIYLPTGQVMNMKKDAADALSAAQQEYQQAEADIKRFEEGSKKLADAVEQATSDLHTAVATARATAAELATAEAVHGINVDTANKVKGVETGGVIGRAGVPDNPLSRSIMQDIDAMRGAAGGHLMNTKQTEMVNHLVEGLRAQGASQSTINGLLAEMRDLHVDHDKALRDIWAALKQMRANPAARTDPGR